MTMNKNMCMYMIIAVVLPLVAGCAGNRRSLAVQQREWDAWSSDYRVTIQTCRDAGDDNDKIHACLERLGELYNSATTKEAVAGVRQDICMVASATGSPAWTDYQCSNLMEQN